MAGIPARVSGTNVPDGGVVVQSMLTRLAVGYSPRTRRRTPGLWVPGNITLRPGEGAFLNNPGRASINLTFTGNPNLPVLPVPITKTESLLLSRQTNDIGTYLNITGTQPCRRRRSVPMERRGIQTNSLLTAPTGHRMNRPTRLAKPGGLRRGRHLRQAWTAPPPIPVPPVITEEPTNVVRSTELRW